ncbi:hypothetical protein ZWY2020_051923, partial [Hordeum vulgare]
MRMSALRRRSRHEEVLQAPERGPARFFTSGSISAVASLDPEQTEPSLLAPPNMLNSNRKKKCICFAHNSIASALLNQTAQLVVLVLLVAYLRDWGDEESGRLTVTVAVTARQRPEETAVADWTRQHSSGGRASSAPSRAVSARLGSRRASQNPRGSASCGDHRSIRSLSLPLPARARLLPPPPPAARVPAAADPPASSPRGRSGPPAPRSPEPHRPAAAGMMSRQQQHAPLRASANGAPHRKLDREGSGRHDSKSHLMRSSSGGFTSAENGGKLGHASPSRDRLVYVMTQIIGHHVDVHVKNGSVISGIFHATNTDKDFGIVLKMAQPIKDTSVGGQINPTDVVRKPETMIIPARELVQVFAKDVTLGGDELPKGPIHDKRKDLMIDSAISRSHFPEERSLSWAPDEGIQTASNWNNLTELGIVLSMKIFIPTKLERGPHMRELEKHASRIAREIEVKIQKIFILPRDQVFCSSRDTDTTVKPFSNVPSRPGSIDTKDLPVCSSTMGKRSKDSSGDKDSRIFKPENTVSFLSANIIIKALRTESSHLCLYNCAKSSFSEFDFPAHFNSYLKGPLVSEKAAKANCCPLSNEKPKASSLTLKLELLLLQGYGKSPIHPPLVDITHFQLCYPTLWKKPLVNTTAPGSIHIYRLHLCFYFAFSFHPIIGPTRPKIIAMYYFCPQLASMHGHY